MSKESVGMNLLQALFAIILGNIVYFLLYPSLPPVARHHPLHIDLGMALDFCLCPADLRIDKNGKETAVNRCEVSLEE